MRTFRNLGDQPAMSFFRSSDGLEVDVVIELGGRLHAIEAKANATPVPRMADALVKWRATVGAEVGSMVLACETAADAPLGGGVVAIPWRNLREHLLTNVIA